jgi:thioredoxin 1
MDHSISDAQFQAEVLQSKGLVLVDFWAPWCMPCQMLGPVIEEIATEMKDKVSVRKMNVDENQQTAGSFGIMSIPTVMLFKDGQQVQTFIGVQPKSVYVDAITKNL